MRLINSNFLPTLNRAHSNNEACSSSSLTPKEDSDSDVDLSSVVINPRLKKEDTANSSASSSSIAPQTTNSVKRKREDTLTSSSSADEELASSISRSDSVKKSSAEPKLTPIDENAEATSATLTTDTKNPEYWHKVSRAVDSFGLNDLINREFGFSGRLGHGSQSGINLYGGVRRPTLLYNSQVQTPRHFIRRALSGLDYVRRMRLTQNLCYHEGCVNALNFNRVGTMLASGSDDFQVCLWDWSKNNLILTFDSGHKSNVFQVIEIFHNLVWHITS